MVVTRRLQDLVAVLPKGRRTPWPDLHGSRDPQGTIDGQHGVVLERHQHIALAHLFVARDIIKSGDEAKDQSGRVKNTPPGGKVASREDFIENRNQGARIGMPSGSGCKSRIVEQFEPIEARG